jgi:hypothetical protein
VSGTWWCTPVIPVLERRQEDCNFKGYIVRLCLKKRKTKERKEKKKEKAEMYFSWFWRLGSPRWRWWCLVKALLCHPIAVGGRSGEPKRASQKEGAELTFITSPLSRTSLVPP